MSLHESVLAGKKRPGMVSCFFFKPVKWMFGVFWEKAEELKEKKFVNEMLLKFM